MELPSGPALNIKTLIVEKTRAKLRNRLSRSKFRSNRMDNRRSAVEFIAWQRHLDTPWKERGSNVISHVDETLDEIIRIHMRVIV